MCASHAAYAIAIHIITGETAIGYIEMCGNARYRHRPVQFPTLFDIRPTEYGPETPYPQFVLLDSFIFAPEQSHSHTQTLGHILLGLSPVPSMIHSDFFLRSRQFLFVLSIFRRHVTNGCN